MIVSEWTNLVGETGGDYFHYRRRPAAAAAAQNADRCTQEDLLPCGLVMLEGDVAGRRSKR